MMDRIAHITDLHLDERLSGGDYLNTRRRFDKVLESIYENRINRIICTGDIGIYKGIEYFFNQLKGIDLTVTLGNHDNFSEVSKYYNLREDYSFDKTYRSTLQGYFKFIYLDSSAGYVDVKQIDWLKKELKVSQSIVIFMHHPILGLGLKVDDIGKLENRDKLKKLLVEIPNSVHLFCGHYHMESTLVYKNITQHITSAVAFQISKSDNKIDLNTSISGYRIIEINESVLASRVVLLNHAI